MKTEHLEKNIVFERKKLYVLKKKVTLGVCLGHQKALFNT